MNINELKEINKSDISIINTGHILLYHGVIYLFEVLKREYQIILEREAKQTDTEKKVLFYQDKPKLEILCINIEIMCCMTVESFMNYYGIINLGNTIYKNTYERLGITQKLEILLAVCASSIIQNDSEILKIVRRMFERRNQLVHPKASRQNISISDMTKEKSRSVDEVPPIQMAEQAINNMNRFFELFTEYNPLLADGIREDLSEMNGFDKILQQMSLFDMIESDDDTNTGNC